MAYSTGTASSGSDLATAIKNACSSNGWSTSSNIVYKGNVYVEILSNWGDNSSGVSIQIGTGQSGGSLTGAAATKVGFRDDFTSGDSTGFNLSYPCTYYIFINTSPDSVTIAVNFDTIKWQHAGFGQANLLTNLTGTGAFCWGYNEGEFSVGVTTYYRDTYYPICFYGFQPYSSTFEYPSGLINLGLDSRTWWTTARDYDGASDDYMLSSQLIAYEYLRHQPNIWNNETVLIRNWLVAERASSFYGYVAEIPHIRFCRNDYINDAEVLTFGSDDWFIASCVEKNTSTRDGGNYHSGTLALAIRKVT